MACRKSSEFFVVARARLSQISYQQKCRKDQHPHVWIQSTLAKTTTLMCSRLVGSHRLQRICRCTLPSRYCSFSLKPHVVLQGRDLQGIAWTRRAQEYTPQFADVIANVFFDSAWSVEFSCRLREIGGLRGPPKALTASSGGCASFALHRASDVT